MKYRVCWKERLTGKVYKDELYTSLERVEDIMRELSAEYSHFYWIEDEIGNYVCSDEYILYA